ncbi:uncharacterized protein LOC129254537 [Lytechinus pictus]|uniref:uncharacterized protein LOC129254537 n=1 Tax=Lytechinus pictus TaxID=7653 RepID=UPI00240E9885|nr:uncharacterized protein LOC129254537 [Lytechinus pictus]
MKCRALAYKAGKGTADGETKPSYNKTHEDVLEVLAAPQTNPEDIPSSDSENEWESAEQSQQSQDMMDLEFHVDEDNDDLYDIVRVSAELAGRSGSGSRPGPSTPAGQAAYKYSPALQRKVSEAESKDFDRMLAQQQVDLLETISHKMDTVIGLLHGQNAIAKKIDSVIGLLQAQNASSQKMDAIINLLQAQNASSKKIDAIVDLLQAKNGKVHNTQE